jgi:hypothetical protein
MLLQTFFYKLKVKNLSAGFSGLRRSNKFILACYFPFNPVVAIADAEKKKQILKELVYEIEKLPEKWDGYNALTISKPVIKNILLMIEPLISFPKLLSPTITPLANGTVSIEWETGQGVAYIEFGETRFSGYIKINDQKPACIEGQTISLSIKNNNIYTLKCIHDLLFPPSVLRSSMYISSK